MAHDLLDPGPNGDYPYAPRRANGTVVWQDDRDLEALSIGVAVPRGVHGIGRRDAAGNEMVINVGHYIDGVPFNPPTVLPVNLVTWEDLGQDSPYG